MSKFEKYFIDINEYKNKELGLSRIDNALRHIHFDVKKLGTVIHIAGTNGKGSTATFLSQIMILENNSVALFTSPHIMKINERIKINNIDITDDEFDKYFDMSFDTINLFGLTYFEAIFFIAMIYFAEQSPDFTILETGLGGRFDATNTSIIDDKICVITKMSSDHTDVFGKNIYSIIDEKLGIIRQHNKLFIAINNNSIIDYIATNSRSNNYQLINRTDFASSIYPFPYSDNYDTAKQVADYITKKKLSDYHNLQLPIGRLEIYKNIIFDPSHNVSGLLALKKYLTNQPIDMIIVSMTKERDIAKAIMILEGISKNIIITSIPNNIRSIDYESIKKLNYKFIANPIDAINSISNHINKLLVVGSFYLVAYCKKHIGLIKL